jgi:hypothetical protein
VGQVWWEELGHTHRDGDADRSCDGIGARTPETARRERPATTPLAPRNLPARLWRGALLRHALLSGYRPEHQARRPAPHKVNALARRRGTPRRAVNVPLSTRLPMEGRCFLVQRRSALFVSGFVAGRQALLAQAQRASFLAAFESRAPEAEDAAPVLALLDVAEAIFVQECRSLQAAPSARGGRGPGCSRDLRDREMFLSTETSPQKVRDAKFVRTGFAEVLFDGRGRVSITRPL